MLDDSDVEFVANMTFNRGGGSNSEAVDEKEKQEFLRCRLVCYTVTVWNRGSSQEQVCAQVFATSRIRIMPRYKAAAEEEQQ